jgi:LysR family glycine cleavage system transcriptional activator
LKKPEDLKRASLLRVAHAREDWPRWLAAAGVSDVRAEGPVFGYYGQALQAAVDGVGVAMGIRPYIDDDLAAGRLIAPFALSVPKETGWYLLYRPHRAAEEGFQAFRRWIVAAAVRPAPRKARRGKS